MSFAARLKASTVSVARVAFGATMGLALVGTVLVGAPPVIAQEAAHVHSHNHAPVVAAVGDGPALWSISDEDSTIYLFGTVHVLKPDTPWGSPKVDAAFDASDALVLEISNPDDQAALVPLIHQHGVSPDVLLSDLLTAEEFAELDRAAQMLGGTGAGFDRMRPWLAALTLSIAPMARAGYDPRSGVEAILKHRAEDAGIPITGLETIDQQVEVLAGLPQEIQVAYLRSTLRDFEQATTELDAVVAAWAAGDVDTINRIGVVEMQAQSPDIYDAMLTRRNQNWANQIQALLAGSGTTFVAVGSAHLVGEDSVQAILQSRGVEVTRR